MELKLKNKHKMALDALLKSASDSSGIPNHFILTEVEYAGLIGEITTLADHVLQHIKVIVPKNHESSFKVNAKFKSTTPLKEQEVIELVALWVKNLYNITYKDIPLLFKDTDDQPKDWKS